MYEWQFRCYVPFKKIEILKLDHLFFIDQSRSLDLSFEPQGTVLDIKSQRFGKCLDCKSQRTAVAWCKNCDIAFFKEKFSNWTSGNSKIDELIRYTQLNAKGNMDFLEWIEFDQFDLIKNINKRGAHSSIYSAVWMEGPRWNLDEESELWSRNGPIKVILKRLDNSHNMSQEFVNQLYRYHKCLQSDALADCFGVTKDPTSCFMFVMKYYENDNLFSYIEETMGILCWRDIVEMLWSISAGNWITAICDDPNRSDLSDQFDAAEEFKFANLEKLNYNVLSCHEVNVLKVGTSLLISIKAEKLYIWAIEQKKKKLVVKFVTIRLTMFEILKEPDMVAQYENTI
ncbi:uncharacterized protein OCT59_028130 [Rhizophagus irregularis]|uniref:uncharacterized protein n=1 Tax=Rhizophagus irregularis TaxID=588596 RepID=UPI003316CDE1|nr:hypothetical protein OCT59_028130 [Rhizophagus irregularis]